MKQLHIIILLLVSACALTACLDSASNSTTSVSDDATVASMYFTANDSMPGLEAASFLIEDRIDTGLIHNVDSILFGTRIDSVIPVFTFNATPAAAIIYTPNDTTMLSVSDTIDFSQRPVYLQVVASDNMHQKWYEIQVNVHLLDPDLFKWDLLSSGIYPTEGAEQKAFELDRTYYILVNNGLENTLYISNNARAWRMANVSGLPTNCQVRNILQIEDMLYYADGNQMYTSINATSWTVSSTNAHIVNLLFLFNGKIWGIAYDSDTEKYHLATSADGLLWTLENELPNNFPVSDYAALTFTSASNRLRAMVIGGFSANGESLNTRWNVEYTEDKGYTWTNFSIEQPNFRSLTGVSVIWYNERFYLFGGVDANNQVGEYAILESVDEGMNWSVPDSAHNCLPDSYQLRSKSSVFVGHNNAIYIVGGQSRTQIFSDVYRGKLNSIDW